MAKVIIEDLDPIVVEKLKNQASLRGRSLHAELKHILESAVLSFSQFAANLPVIPLEDLQQSVQTSLRESGYDSREKIVELVQEVKKEIADEFACQMLTEIRSDLALSQEDADRIERELSQQLSFKSKIRYLLKPHNPFKHHLRIARQLLQLNLKLQALTTPN